MQAAEEAALEMGLAQKRVDIFKGGGGEDFRGLAKAAAEHKQQQGQQDDKIGDLNAETAELRAQASGQAADPGGPDCRHGKARAALEKEAAGIRFDAVAKAEKERDAAKAARAAGRIGEDAGRTEGTGRPKTGATQKEAADKAAEGRKAEAAYLESKRPLADQLRDRLADVVRLQRSLPRTRQRGANWAAQREADRLRAQMADAPSRASGKWRSFPRCSGRSPRTSRPCATSTGTCSRRRWADTARRSSAGTSPARTWWSLTRSPSGTCGRLPTTWGACAK